MKVALIFFTVIAVLFGLLAIGAIYLCSGLIEDYQTSLRGYGPGVLPATPTVIVKPDVPPDTYLQDRLNRTEPFVGLWESYLADINGWPVAFDHYNLTIYNDGNYVIHDVPNDTYITGKWTKSYDGKYNRQYRATEGGKSFVFIINSVSYSVQFQYDNPVDTGYPVRTIDFRRVYYPGLYADI
ncbi:MAG: hypothetical protein A4E28_01907 [Methanocella sp. PtaU1.Bin125]|nr:MAG: hypothetical protein A4E28_01907 [Methanocella sp. PtaU1.Bin125]